MTITNEAQLANSLETLLRVGFDYLVLLTLTTASWLRCRLLMCTLTKQQSHSGPICRK